MPEWLLKTEHYKPKTDKDTFINRSILSLLGILSKIRTQSGHPSDKFKLNAMIKVVCTFMLVVLLSLSRSFFFVIIINVYLLVLLSLMDGKEIVKVLRISLVMAVFTFIILLPAVYWNNSYSCIMITSKVFATVTAVNMLSHTTRWNQITSALTRFFVPDIFILVLDITIKYIVMLGDFALNMFYALKLRSVGINNNKYTSLSGIAGTMFIKSKEMAEDMYAAMECRGFTGEYKIYSKLKISWQDLIFVTINLFIVFIFIYFERMQ